jgi:hypothetical protein
MEVKENTIFWYDDHTILFEKNNLIEFYPSPSYSLNRKLNAIFRLSIYSSVIASIYTNNPKYISILIIGAIVTILISKSKQNKKTEGLENTTFNAGPCTEPTIDNPFMNFTM